MNAKVEDEYLILVGKGFLGALSEEFKKLDGFYTGITWAFPSQSREALASIVQELPHHDIHVMPLAEGQTIDGHKAAFKAQFFENRLREVQDNINVELGDRSLEEFSEESIRDLEASDEEKEALFELLNRKEGLEHQIGVANALEAAKKDNNKLKIQFISDREKNFLLEDAPDLPRLVNFIDGGKPKPFIRKGIVAELVGGGGTGKTHALCSLAISVATGTNWLGLYPIESAGNVFMMMSENGDDDVHRLFRKTAKFLTRTMKHENPEELLLEASKRISVMSTWGMDATLICKYNRTDFFEKLKSELIDKEPDEGWSLIILDPLSRFMGADAETDNAAATKFISLIEELILSLKGKPTIILAHHMNKSAMSGGVSDQGAGRGSSAITDGVRWQANLELVFEGKDANRELLPNQVTLRNVKSNFTKILPSQILTKGDNGCLTALQEGEKKEGSCNEKPSHKTPTGHNY